MTVQIAAHKKISIRHLLTPLIICTFWVEHRMSIGVTKSLCLKHTTTLLALSDHYILSREWRVIVDQVQTNYHGRPMVL